MCAYIPILMWLLICYSPDAYQVPTVCARPYALSLRGKVVQKVWYGFRHSHGWWCWGQVGEFVGVRVLASGGDLGREQCVGGTQESCSTAEAGILKRPSPVRHDMATCLTNKKSVQF